MAMAYTPDAQGNCTTGNWSAPIDSRQFLASGTLRDGEVFVIGGDSKAGPDSPLGEILDPQSNTWPKLTSKPARFDPCCFLLRPCPTARFLFDCLETIRAQDLGSSPIGHVTARNLVLPSRCLQAAAINT